MRAATIRVIFVLPALVGSCALALAAAAQKDRKSVV